MPAQHSGARAEASCSHLIAGGVQVQMLTKCGEVEVRMKATKRAAQFELVEVTDCLE